MRRLARLPALPARPSKAISSRCSASSMSKTAPRPPSSQSVKVSINPHLGGIRINPNRGIDSADFYEIKHHTSEDFLPIFV